MRLHLKPCICTVLFVCVSNCLLLLYVHLGPPTTLIVGHSIRWLGNRNESDQATTDSPSKQDYFNQGINSNSGIQHVLFKINKESVCAHSRILTLLIVVLSDAEDAPRRTAIRQSWGRNITVTGPKSRLVMFFMVKDTKKESLQKALEIEDSKHRDIVLIYSPLTSPNGSSHDFLSLHHWVRTYCVNTRYVLYVDDTTLVNVENMMRYVETSPKVDFLGFKNHNVQHMDVSREDRTTVKTLIRSSSVDLPVLISIDVVLRASGVLHRERHFHLTDINSYIHMLEDTLHIPVVNINGFEEGTVSSTTCHLQNSLTLRSVEPDHMDKLWQKLGRLNIPQNWTAEKNDLNFESGTKLGYKDPFSQLQFKYHAGNLCSRFPGEETFLLVVTVSAPHSTRLRDAIRKSRGRLKYIERKKIYQFFFIEAPSSPDIYDERILKESQTYYDIILSEDQSEKPDSQIPTFLKILQWVTSHCKNTRYLMIVDNRIFVNLRYLVNTLYDTPTDCFFLGSFENKSSEHLKITNEKHQLASNAEKVDVFHDMSLSSQAYVISAEDLPRRILKMAQNKPSLYHDSSYLVRQLRHFDVMLVHHHNFKSFGTKVCELKTAITSSVYMTADDMYEKWRIIEEWNEYINCTELHPIDQNRHTPSSAFVHRGRVFGLDSQNEERGDSPFLVNHPDKCKTDDSAPHDVFMLVGILTHPKYTEKRKIIRETWAMYKNVSGLRVETLFFVGVIDNEKEKKSIAKENIQYGDIIQSNFVESYEHLVLKTLSIIQWTSQFCKKAKYLIKVDDDVFLNYHNLVEFLRFSPRDNFYMGDILLGTAIRGIEDKWFTPLEFWPGWYYPPYANGPAYVLSTDVLQRILNMVKNNPIFKWEDTYIGIVMQRLNIAPYPHIHFDTQGLYSHPCAFPLALAYHRVKENKIRRFWKILQDSPSKEKCIGITPGKLKPVFHISPLQSNTARTSVVENRTLFAYDHFQYYTGETIPPNPPFLLVIVMATPEYKYRKYQRLLFGRLGSLSDRIMLRFFIHTPHDQHHIREFIRHENELYRDILHETSNGGRNITHNVLSALRWATSLNQSARFIMILNTNVHVNVENLMHHLESAPQSNYTFCSKHSSKPVERSVNSKWYISMDEWKDEIFPPYCDDKAATIISTDVAKKLVNLSPKVPFFRFHDIYLGVLFQQLNISIQHGEGFQTSLMCARPPMVVHIEDTCLMLTTKLTCYGFSHMAMLDVLLKGLSNQCKRP